jgi:signal peptidase I
VALIVAAAFVLALLIQQFVVKPFYIPSPSMEPTLSRGDRVLVNRMVYRFSEPEIGDIVVFHPPIAPGEDYIKRVVALAGDTVAVQKGTLYVNGEAQEEPFLKEKMDSELDAEVIPEGHLFVMGDNRNSSGDSRVFGPVAEDELLGRAFVIYWPLSRLDFP